MVTASVSEQGWVKAEGRILSLVVRLRQRSLVLPWPLFLYAEGTDGQVRIVFHTHVIALEGAGLSSLLADLAVQSVTELIEPDRTAKFSPGAGPRITALSVAENK